MRYGIIGLFLLGFIFVGSGCIVRVYEKEMPRKDILVEGNQGYLVGEPETSVYVPEKKTRKVIVTEIELINPREIKIEKGEKRKTATRIESDSISNEIMEKNTEEPENGGNLGYIYKKETIEMEENRETGESGETADNSNTQKEEGAKGSSVVKEEQEAYVKGINNRAVVQDNDYILYKVKKGDTLQKISYKFYGKYSLWPKIFEANKDRLENPDSLYVGQEIKVPVLNKK